MTPAEAWSRALARQADADLRAFDPYGRHPSGPALEECHRLMFLQMACEKLCKAHLIRGGSDPASVQGSHAYIAGPLPAILRERMQRSGEDLRKWDGWLTWIRRLSREIELLNPAVEDGGRRPENCEYP